MAQPRYIMDITGWLADKHTFSQRKHAAVRKKTLRAVGVDWHKETFPGHFDRSAYGRYRQFYHMRFKKGSGRPMFKKGNLKSRTTSSSGVKIAATSKKLTIRIPIGNPKQKTKSEIQKEIFITMRQKRVNYKKAQRLVRSENSYKPSQIKQFKDALPAIINKEEREMVKKIIKWETSWIMVSARRKASARKRVRS